MRNNNFVLPKEVVVSFKDRDIILEEGDTIQVLPNRQESRKKSYLNLHLNDVVIDERGREVLLRDYLIDAMENQGYTGYSIEKTGVREIIHLERDDGGYIIFGTKDIKEFIIGYLSGDLPEDVAFEMMLEKQIEEIKAIRKTMDYDKLIESSRDFYGFKDIPIMHNLNNLEDDLDLWLDILLNEFPLIAKNVKRQYGRESQITNLVYSLSTNLKQALLRIYNKTASKDSFIRLKMGLR